MNEFEKALFDANREIKTDNQWQWFNTKANKWQNISPANMDAIIAHGLKPDPEFRKANLEETIDAIIEKRIDAYVEALKINPDEHTISYREVYFIIKDLLKHCDEIRLV